MIRYKSRSPLCLHMKTPLAIKQNPIYQTLNELSVELGISADILRLHCWINKYDEYGESAFPCSGSALFNSAYEIKRLQKANDGLRMENELLKNSRRFARFVPLRKYKVRKPFPAEKFGRDYHM